MLSIERLTSGYVEEIDILKDISMDVRGGAITGVIGPNGAGKSTLLKTIFGLLHPRRGKIFFKSKEIQNYRSDQLKQMGISYMLQEYGTFPRLTVNDNLLLGGWVIRQDRELVRQRLKEVYDFFPELWERRAEKATNLSGGVLRMLCIGREIMTKPELLLLDEPSTGLSPKIVRKIYSFLQKIAELGTTILLVDQNIMKALEVSDFMYLLDMGQIKQGGPKEDFKECIRKIIKDSLIAT